MRLTVNGREHTLPDLDPNMPVLWALRDHLGLTGTKYGCGIALCGACTIHLDGQPARACTVRVGDVGDAAITTIEGLSEDGSHPVQNAWRDANVPQCGFCQAGQIMSAAALLASNHAPTDDDIDAALAANLCRCGTYVRIRSAVHAAAEEMRG